MKFRKLRIAWSVFLSLLWVLVVVLWVRSYWHRDLVTYSSPTGHRVAIGSNRGNVYLIHRIWQPDPGQVVYYGWQYGNGAASELRLMSGWTPLQPWTKIVIPHVLLLFALVLAACFSWVRYRFSLRTLLIVMTAASVALALIVGLSRR